MHPSAVINEGDIQPQDVLMGRWSFSYCHIGNVAFRFMIRSRLKAYRDSRKQSERTDMFSQARDSINAVGGRFLKRCGDGTWYEVDKSESRVKIAQSFRDGHKIQGELSMNEEQSRQLLGKINADTPYHEIIMIVSTVKRRRDSKKLPRTNSLPRTVNDGEDGRVVPKGVIRPASMRAAASNKKSPPSISKRASPMIGEASLLLPPPKNHSSSLQSVEDLLSYNRGRLSLECSGLLSPPVSRRVFNPLLTLSSPPCAPLVTQSTTTTAAAALVAATGLTGTRESQIASRIAQHQEALMDSLVEERLLLMTHRARRRLSLLRNSLLLPAPTAAETESASLARLHEAGLLSPSLQEARASINGKLPGGYHL